MSDNDKGIVDYRQVEGLRKQGLNDEQICSALGIDKDELAKSTARAITGGQVNDNFGPLVSFTPEQIQTVQNIVFMEAVNGDSSAARLRAASMILELHSISASDKFKAAKGLNTTQTINNIMVAVTSAQELKKATIAE